MSNNVVPMIRPTKELKTARSTDMSDLIAHIVDWAEDQGIDLDNDVGFQIRCADFMAYLEILAKDERLRDHG
jgi:hypothetical protein